MQSFAPNTAARTQPHEPSRTNSAARTQPHEPSGCVPAVSFLLARWHSWNLLLWRPQFRWAWPGSCAARL